MVWQRQSQLLLAVTAAARCCFLFRARSLYLAFELCQHTIHRCVAKRCKRIVL